MKPHRGFAFFKRIRPSGRVALILTSVLSNVLRLAGVLVLARIVPKSEYGLFGLLIAWPGLLGGLGDLGANVIVRQVRDLDRREVDDTALMMVGCLSVYYMVINVAGGAILSWYQDDWRLIFASMMIGATTGLAMLYSVQLNLLNRDFKFGAETLQNILFSICSFVAAIGFASIGMGIFALAGQSFVAQIVANGFALRRGAISLPRKATWRSFRRAVSLTWTIAVTNYLSNLETRTFELVAARVGGLNLLADWRQALTAQSMVSQNVNSGIDRVVFPSLSSSIDDPQRFDQIARRGLEIMLLVNVGLAVWLSVNSVEIVSIVLGAQWMSVAPILAGLAVVLPSAAFASMGYNGALATGHTRPLLWWAIPRIVLTCVGLSIAVQSVLGLVGFFVVGRTCYAVATFLVVAAAMRMSFGRSFSAVLAIVLCGAIALASGNFVKPTLSLLPNWLNLTLSSAVIFSTYLAAVYLGRRDTLLFALKNCRSR